MKLLGLYNHGSANTHYRAIVPMREMERRGHRVEWPTGQRGLLNYLDGRKAVWDVVHIHQASGPEEIAAARRLREQGVGVVWDIDDDMTSLPRNSGTYRTMGGRRGMKKAFHHSVEMAKTACLMTTSSERLAELYRDAGVERLAVIENHVDRGEAEQPRRRHPGVVIGIVAAFEHEQDIKKLKIGRVLKAILERNPEVMVVALGCDVGLSGPRYQRHTMVPFEQLLQVERGFDIGLAPLIDSPFARARSNVKVKEYAAAGAMWLASPVGSYRGMGEEQGGLLVEPGDWVEAIDAHVLDYRRRVALAERARAWARAGSIESAGPQWEQAFKTAQMLARDGSGGSGASTAVAAGVRG